MAGKIVLDSAGKSVRPDRSGQNRAKQTGRVARRKERIMAQQKAVEQPLDDAPESVVDELQPGTKLLKGQYTITRFLNNGGFGITYVAKDSLNRTVVIKECFPNAFCRRSKTVVAARSRAHQAELRSVVQLFVREAHNMAQLVHPNIVAVHQVFEDNGTAYMAIDYIDGRDLLETIEDKAVRLEPAKIVTITEKMLSAVGFIHECDMLHRDISPDNILLNKHGEPILIDFGAAREQASRKSRALTALRVVKDGYSPQEFYIAGSEQGPWSDLYALGATLYHLISGEAPVNGQVRLAALAENRPDPYKPLFGRFSGYPVGFLEAIDKVLNTIPRNRLQSAADWLRMFKEGVAPTPAESDLLEAAVLQMIAETADEAPHVAEPPAAPEPVKAPAPVAAAPRIETPDEVEDPAGPELTAEPEAPAALDVPVATAKAGARFAPIPDGEPLAETAAPAPRRRLPLMAGIAAAAAIAGLAYVMTGGSDDASPAAPVVVKTGALAQKTETSLAALSSGSVAADPKIAAAVSSARKKPMPKPAIATAVKLPAASAPKVAMAAALPPAERVAAPVIKAVAPLAPVAAVQVSFAAWDVRMPFSETTRLTDGQQVALVSQVNPSADLALSGDWIRPGISIRSVNGAALQKGATVAGSVLGGLHVDPDGYARASVGYTDELGAAQTGLLAVPAVRMVSLANGVSATADYSEGQWRTVVAAVRGSKAGGLRVGDVLFRDKTSGVAIDGPEALEQVVTALAGNKLRAAEFSIIRGDEVLTETMFLATEAPAAVARSDE